jgi:hypothetical protein
VTSIPAVEGQNRCSLRKASMPSSTTVQVGVAPLSGAARSVVQLRKQRQAVQPSRSSGRLTLIQTIAAFGRGRFEQRRLPFVGRSLSSKSVGRHKEVRDSDVY